MPSDLHERSDRLGPCKHGLSRWHALAIDSGCDFQQLDGSHSSRHGANPGKRATHVGGMFPVPHSHAAGAGLVMGGRHTRREPELWEWKRRGRLQQQCGTVEIWRTKVRACGVCDACLLTVCCFC